MDRILECENFEPETRARSNTWPLRQPEKNPEELSPSPLQSDIPSVLSPQCSIRKSSHRRNAWGNMSYAELITLAITSSPEKRKTLSDIYEWMVTNVPYFRDKGDSNSSAGWKNSVRHNLSLHNRFMRVQNETPGKSSWWMINPDPKPGKTARRRAYTMENSKTEKRKERIKKKIEAIRNGLSEKVSENSSGHFDGMGEMESYNNYQIYRREPLSTQHEVGMELDWTKSSENDFRHEIKEEPEPYYNCMQQNNQKLPPFSTTYELNINFQPKHNSTPYPSYPAYHMGNYQRQLQCKSERLSPLRNPMLSSTSLDSNPILRERLLDPVPSYTNMGQFMEVLNQNVFMDSFQQNGNVILSQDNYPHPDGIKQECGSTMEETLEDQLNQKTNELSVTPTSLEPLFTSQYRNFVLT